MRGKWIVVSLLILGTFGIAACVRRPQAGPIGTGEAPARAKDR